MNEASTPYGRTGRGGGPGSSCHGPAEATALGNVLVQARALGAAPGDLAGMRALIRSTQPLRSYSPAGDRAAWASAAARL